jgi:hypothetical protein
VTVSYGPDRDRCALLSRSLDALAPSVAHWIVLMLEVWLASYLPRAAAVRPTAERAA